MDIQQKREDIWYIFFLGGGCISFLGLCIWYVKYKNTKVQKFKTQQHKNAKIQKNDEDPPQLCRSRAP